MTHLDAPWAIRNASAARGGTIAELPARSFTFVVEVIEREASGLGSVPGKPPSAEPPATPPPALTVERGLEIAHANRQSCIRRFRQKRGLLLTLRGNSSSKRPLVFGHWYSGKPGVDPLVPTI